jgi:DNA-directed RNA polymerase subunit alpha
VTAVRIAGVTHEFATVPGVREDVLEILMRMKEVILRSYSSQPQIGRLLVNGPATVTVAHFDLPGEVEVIDQTQYVATLAEGGKLERVSYSGARTGRSYLLGLLANRLGVYASAKS